MKLPRDVSAHQLLRVLRRYYGYEIMRQEGSHIRLRTSVKGGHSITLPDHNPIKVGTLSHIIKDIALHHGVDASEIIEKL